ncbi:protein phosphatase 2C domain-containing protein [Chondrinema litorale]|uniref:protein phosphatase 2C domain-containing protein n=1 Tax=Chondrinema litorale TaxID=2994555 RepID=UPI00254394B5|nr:protein phosphatase 2C domain-containing protein [Chondrinema litorale]UZR97637.1 protein phosphatase 2C domain-containing protein [Chondrinema litorale]
MHICIVNDLKFYSTLQIGSFHTNHCEDFLINEDLSRKTKLIAVMDGCTMGTESVFASILIGKLLRKIAKDKFYRDFIDTKQPSLKDDLKDILSQLFIELREIRNKLLLDTSELLSTLVIGLIDGDTFHAEFLVVGDGLIYKDGQAFEFEQNDMPDYLAYHLSEQFDDWYSSQKQIISFSDFKDISICTDGIFTFKPIKKNQYVRDEQEVLDFLLKDTVYEDQNNLLDRKIRILKDQCLHENTDDLAIIRIRKKE